MHMPKLAIKNRLRDVYIKMSPSLRFQHQPCDIPTLSWEAQSDNLALSSESQLVLSHKNNAVISAST